MKRAVYSKYHIATFVGFPSDSTCRLAHWAGKENASSGNCDGGTSTTPASDYAASCASIGGTISEITQSRSVNLAAIAEKYGRRIGAKRTWAASQPLLGQSGHLICRTSGRVGILKSFPRYSDTGKGGQPAPSVPQLLLRYSCRAGTCRFALPWALHRPRRGSGTHSSPSRQGPGRASWCAWTLQCSAGCRGTEGFCSWG